MTAVDQVHDSDWHRQRWDKLEIYNGKTGHRSFTSLVSFYFKKNLKQVGQNVINDFFWLVRHMILFTCFLLKTNQQKWLRITKE